jgi:hypothetical protein
MSLRREHEELVRAMRRGKNALRLALTEQRGAKGYARAGASLAGGQALIRTYRTAAVGLINHDRYKRRLVKPEVDASIHIAIDASGSMGQGVRGSKVNLSGHLMMASHALADLGKSLKVEVESHLCFMAGHRHQAFGQTGYDARLVPIVVGNRPTAPLKSHVGYCPTDGTHIATYARAALALAERSSARHRIAVYMTDGCCNSISYLPSLQLMAKARGIYLVGVVMGGESAEGHPNAVECLDGGDFASQVGLHLAKVVKGRG